MLTLYDSLMTHFNRDYGHTISRVFSIVIVINALCWFILHLDESTSIFISFHILTTYAIIEAISFFLYSWKSTPRDFIHIFSLSLKTITIVAIQLVIAFLLLIGLVMPDKTFNYQIEQALH